VTTRPLYRARDEAGNALVIALVVMGLLTTLGLALLKQVDSEQEEGGRQRARESSFQVAEGALNAQIFQLSTRWPDSSTPYPTACDQGTMGQQDCPSTNAMVSTFQNVDQAKSTAWTTHVRDNDPVQPNYWSDSLLSGAAYDANGDGYVWVRATALVNSRRRSLVALIKAEKTMIPPAGGSHALVAGYFRTSNDGNKVIIDTDGASDQFTNGDVVVRCPFTDANPPEPNCAEYITEKNNDQVSPERVFSNADQPGLSPEQLAAVRTAAKAAGNYYDSTYTGCPPLVGDKPGETVFIEQLPPSGCTYNGNDDYNTAAKPGVVVIGKGKIYLLGNAIFYGLLYHANLDPAHETEVLIDLGGNCTVVGAVSVDGPGGVYAGSSKTNIVFDGNVFTNFEGLNRYGTASIVPNTFREIVATA
jgi:Tfp pilus assembly protein PilX